MSFAFSSASSCVGSIADAHSQWLRLAEHGSRVARLEWNEQRIEITPCPHLSVYPFVPSSCCVADWIRYLARRGCQREVLTCTGTVVPRKAILSDAILHPAAVSRPIV